MFDINKTESYMDANNFFRVMWKKTVSAVGNRKYINLAIT